MADYFDTGETTEVDTYSETSSSEYLRLRAKADRLYKKRNQLSQKSQAAYCSGNGKRAYELSEQSKKIMDQADSVSLQAAEYVFRENNEYRGPHEIDLHGLFVKEAIDFLEQRISHDLGIKQRQLQVITGKGLHSADGVPKLMIAVEDLCEEMGLKHHTDPCNAGILVIELGNDSEKAPQETYYGSGQSQSYPQGVQVVTPQKQEQEEQQRKQQEQEELQRQQEQEQEQHRKQEQQKQEQEQQQQSQSKQYQQQHHQQYRNQQYHKPSGSSKSDIVEISLLVIFFLLVLLLGGT
ncbi:Smr domain-containing protein [Spathaspora sp. JA1]|nr:Smr domain-containing protein [Spathaspora sp. JA1]